MQTITAIQSPFAELRKLLSSIAPPTDKTPIDLSIGAPRHSFPHWVGETLLQAQRTLGQYPPIDGTDALRQAITDWAERRYPTLDGKIDPTCHILPLNGSREGLFYAIFIAKERRSKLANPVILIPNPFYQCYATAAIASGAEPIYLPSHQTDDFLPCLDKIAPDILERTIAFYLCSPSNPEGAIASKKYLKQAIELARHYNFMLFVDECYSEIYDANPPTGALETAAEFGNGFDNVLSFNSLSKRSNVPGLRSGFVMGDKKFIQSFKTFRNVASPQMPLPTQHVSTKLWQDEAHVEANRNFYRQKFNCAEKILIDKINFKKPAGGFFLWLNMAQFGTSKDITKTLWQYSGVKVLPGSFLAQAQADGTNPGEYYIRIALVDDLTTTEEALSRINLSGL